MYPSKIEQNLVISLEMKLGIIDEKLRTDLNKLGGVREEFLKDAVTHVFGTFNEKTGVISFLGFSQSLGSDVRSVKGITLSLKMLVLKITDWLMFL